MSGECEKCGETPLDCMCNPNLESDQVKMLKICEKVVAYLIENHEKPEDLFQSITSIVVCVLQLVCIPDEDVEKVFDAMKEHYLRYKDAKDREKKNLD